MKNNSDRHNSSEIIYLKLINHTFLLIIMFATCPLSKNDVRNVYKQIVCQIITIASNFSVK